MSVMKKKMLNQKKIMLTSFWNRFFNKERIIINKNVLFIEHFFIKYAFILTRTWYILFWQEHN